MPLRRKSPPRPELFAAQQALFFSVPFLLALVGALVVLELAAPEPDLELDAALAVMQVERHQRVAALLDLADQAPDLLGAQQQLAGAARIRSEVRGRGRKRADVGADQEDLLVAHHDVPLADGGAAGADRLD